jgi:hypothetical protein
MDRRAELYAAQVQQLINGSAQLTPQSEAAITELLAKAGAEILGRLAQMNSGSYSSLQLNQMRAEIDKAMQRFSQDATKAVNALQETAAKVATRDVSSTIGAALGKPVSLGAINQQTVRIAQGYTADLITGLSADASAKIKGTIQRAFLGGQGLPEIIDQVGRALEGGKFSGIFTEVGDRAMRVAMNEVLRVHSISGQARMYELAKQNPGVKKMWKHIPAARVPRLSHILADGQIRDVDDAFFVAGEDLMFPRDPSGSPENTIFCHCVSVPYVDDSALTATQSDRDLLASVGLKVERSDA